jgi:hypothetical protein
MLTPHGFDRRGGIINLPCRTCGPHDSCAPAVNDGDGDHLCGLPSAVTLSYAALGMLEDFFLDVCVSSGSDGYSAWK